MTLECIYRVAEQYIGTKEIKGSEHNPTIVGWIKRFAKNIGRWGQSRDETAWCAVFVSMVLNKCGIQGTDHALARSYISWGKGAKLDKGAVVVIRDNKTKRFHVGFLNRLSKHYIVVLGGNQRDSVRVSYYPRKRFDVVAIRQPVTL